MELIEPHVTERRFKTWPEARRFLEELGPQYLFRGHGNARWTLASSLERCSTTQPPHEIELLLRGVFRSAAHLYEEVLPAPDDVISWLALMQHHRVPTRLLDCTRSPHVASYFAAQYEASAEESYCIWAFDFISLKNAAVEHLKAGGYAIASTIPLGRSERFRECIINNTIPLIAPLRPAFYNLRQTNQRGLFLCPGTVGESFIRNLHAMERDMEQQWGFKIVLPHETRLAALKDLYSLNVHPAPLFPGLDGFADSLRLRLRLLQEAREAHQWNLEMDF